MIKPNILRPSSAYQWSACPASFESQKKYKAGCSSAAEEGTLAHKLAELMALGERYNVVDYPEEMIEYCQNYVEFIRSHDGELFIEMGLDLSSIYPNGFGTADAVIVNATTNIVTVIDLKYGKGVRVDADCHQLKLYALGVLVEFNYINFTNVVVKIYQPRLDHFDTKTYNIDELEQFKLEIQERAKIALSPNPPFNPGESQCRFCNHKASCEALHKHTYDLIAGSFEDETKRNKTLSDFERLKQIYEDATLIKQLLDAVEQRVKSLLENDIEFYDYRLVAGRGRRVFKSNIETILAQHLNDDDIYTRKIKGVTDIEKTLGKSKFKGLNLTDFKQGSMKIVKKGVDFDNQ